MPDETRVPPLSVVRELPASETGAKQVLVKSAAGDYFVVSSVVAPYSGFETLVFPANEDGEVTDWAEVAGGRGVGRDAAIAYLQERLADSPDGRLHEDEDV